MNEELLATLATTPDRLAAEIEELTESELRRRHPDGGWNLKELAGHLRDAELVWSQQRLPRMLEEENPDLPGFDEEEYIRESNALESPIGEPLAEWKTLREQTVNLLRGVGPASLGRTARHPSYGDITVAQVPSILAEHDEGHYAQALRLKGLSREPSS